MKNPHVLVASFPAQGHINPSLQFAQRLATMGLKVTFATTIGADRRMAKTGIPDNLSFAALSDGNDDGFKPIVNIGNYMTHDLRLHGSQTLRRLIQQASNDGHPFTFVVYSILIPWVAKVAREFHLPSALLWSQPATVFSIYYHYFNGYGEIIEKTINSATLLLNLPNLPVLSVYDLPSFFSPAKSNEYAFVLPVVKEHLEILDEEIKHNPKSAILVNTFDALEVEVLKSIDKYKLVGVGPLLRSGSFGGSLFQESNGYIEWLNSKPQRSVIYISFGSISVMSEQQIEEMAIALEKIGSPFLWVIRENAIVKEKLNKGGLTVPWCNQVEVLSNPAIGCFITHCGWNSTFESLTCGVPMVGFPQWTDQMTNAKLVQDLWKVGVRVVVNEEGIVEAKEIRRCLELVMGDGDGGKEMRKSAKKWKDLAREAINEGGSTDKNVKAFVDVITSVDEVEEGC
ncbi:hypothetical protein JCGZ_13140 [Jatropha curcas]|uniref:Glycosyltransferase n=1 Tax=Jatropha curcas TaxID=180498 RepID=A0A067KK03_JATCU|nr:UDP-glycosyltransferase 75C1 [Jatropha curcas]KDP32590.1 hypothetical protein JCGZ_13140 [Jatropha curcas]